MNEFTLREKTDDQKPYERCRMHGPEALTDSELLAVLLRTGSKNRDVLALAEAILAPHYRYDGLSALIHMSYDEYLQIEGIGSVKAVQLMCLGEICRRLWRHEGTGQCPTMRKAAAVAQYFQQEMKFLEREMLKAVFLDRNCRLMSEMVMTTGGENASIAPIKEIVREALRHRAVFLIIVHNHPGGSPEPSTEDISVTRNLEMACQTVGIPLSDHVIIAGNDYYSFYEHGMLHCGGN